jgi:hypothetical protein
MLKQEQPTLKQNYFHFQIKSRCRSCCSGQTMDAKAKLAANAKTKTSAEVAAQNKLAADAAKNKCRSCAKAVCRYQSKKADADAAIRRHA